MNTFKPIFKPRFILSKFLLVAVISVAVLAAGCGGNQPAQAPQATPVKAMQVVTKDVPVVQEFVGEVVAKEEIELKPKVSGQIIAKMVAGGAGVRQGQPLFKIDTRDYEAALLNAQANLANSEAALSDTRLDVERYKMLIAKDAISRQQLDQILTKEKQNMASVQAYAALVKKAQNDIDDTVVVSPIDGRIDIKDLSIGNYAVAGTTVLANISSTNPIHVKFSMSESIYLQLMNRKGSDANDVSGYAIPLDITLSDGSTYPLQGQVVQVDKGLSGTTGTLTLKAEFPNPQRILTPGMFARVVVVGEVRTGALLIPQRAIQEILGKPIVSVIGEEEKIVNRSVKLGPKYGSFQVVEEGIEASDRVIVEGLTKVRQGSLVQATMMQPDEITAPATK